jgi:ferric-dicitrate binding protein FerR (iron transport regulator)
MEHDKDVVESLIRSAGRRAQPPEEAYRQVFAAASDAFRRKTARRRDRMWLAWASVAAAFVIAVAVVLDREPTAARGDALAQLARAIGGVEIAFDDAWQPLAASRSPLTAGVKLRTLAHGRAALALSSGESFRLAGGTEVILDAPGRVYVQRGTIYVDSGADAHGPPIEIVTPAGTARNLGTQFELRVAGAALRLRVREGSVVIDRGGRSLTGAAGEEIEIDRLGGVSRNPIAPDDAAWQWAESIAPVPDVDGKPAAILISWAARETGRRLRYASPAVQQRAASVILHGNIRHLPPLTALEAMLATTDLTVVLRGDTMEIHARDVSSPEP